MNDETTRWLVLITNLPGHNPKLRMRVWRALKGAGAGLLRDGVYLLPSSPESRQVFENRAAEINAGGGTAHILPVDSEAQTQFAAFRALFDRTEEYAELIGQLDAFKRRIPRLPETEGRQQFAALGRETSSIITRDFFPGKPRVQAEEALQDALIALDARFSPDEPHAAHRKIQRRDLKAYQGRTWATRERLWVDRVASAWLIRRFIDPDANLLWLKHVKDRPRRAVGYDFDGAEFTHVGGKVSFEVLSESFKLEHDVGIARIGALVHYLDVGGIPVAEAAGFVSILAGARALQPDDNALLRAMTPVLDSLYAAYCNRERP